MGDFILVATTGMFGEISEILFIIICVRGQQLKCIVMWQHIHINPSTSTENAPVYYLLLTDGGQ